MSNNVKRVPPFSTLISAAIAAEEAAYAASEAAYQHSASASRALWEAQTQSGRHVLHAEAHALGLTVGQLGWEEAARASLAARADAARAASEAACGRWREAQKRLALIE
jgi:hypothetical protein